MYRANQMAPAQTSSPHRNPSSSAQRAHEVGVEGESFSSYWQQIAVSEQKPIPPERSLTRESNSHGSRVADRHETKEVDPGVNSDEKPRKKRLSGREHVECVGSPAEGLSVVLSETTARGDSSAAVGVEALLADACASLHSGNVSGAWLGTGRGAVANDGAVSSGSDASGIDPAALMDSLEAVSKGDPGQSSVELNASSTGIVDAVKDFQSSPHTGKGHTGTGADVLGLVGSSFKNPASMVLVKEKGLGLLGTGGENVSSIGLFTGGLRPGSPLDPTGRFAASGKARGREVDAAALVTKPMFLGMDAAGGLDASRSPQVAETTDVEPMAEDLVAEDMPSVSSEIEQAMVSLAGKLESWDADSDAYPASVGLSGREFGSGILGVQLAGTSMGVSQRGSWAMESRKGKEVGNAYLAIPTASFAASDSQDKADALSAGSGRILDLPAESTSAEPLAAVGLSSGGVGDDSESSPHLAAQLSSAEREETQGNNIPADIFGVNSDIRIDSNARFVQMNAEAEPSAARRLPSPQEIVDQLVERVRIGHAGADEMHIQLKPDWLGKVKIKVAVENGLVTAHFAAESETVKSLLESGMSLLRENLENQGFSLAEFSVDVSNGQTLGNSGFSGDSQNGYQSGGWMPHGVFNSDSSHVAGAIPEHVDPARTRIPGGEYVVDYLA